MASRITWLFGIWLIADLAVPVFAGEPAISFRPPLPPTQCDLALEQAQREVDRGYRSNRLRMLAAEGLLCKGIDQDVVALDLAIRLLRVLASSERADAFVLLDLADALRKRFPLSIEAESVLGKATTLLTPISVGAGYAETLHYVRQNQAALRLQRAEALPVLSALRQRALGGTLDQRDAARLVAISGAMGLEELAAAKGPALFALRQEPPESRDRNRMLADIFLARGNPVKASMFYQRVLETSCERNTTSEEAAACLSARASLSKVEDSVATALWSSMVHQLERVD